MLSAMLRIAEGEIRAKDEQLVLLQQIIATNEKEIRAKDERVTELEERIAALQLESEQFQALFNKYLTKAEAARAHSVFKRAPTTSTGEVSTADSASSCSSVGGSSSLPPPSAAGLLGVRAADGPPSVALGAPPDLDPPQLAPPTPPKKQHIGRSDDDLVPPPPEDDAPLSPLHSAAESEPLCDDGLADADTYDYPVHGVERRSSESPVDD